MTPNPHAVTMIDSVGRARELMRDRKIHHLPVIDDHSLVGIVSEHDLAWRYDDRVGDAMTREVAAVDDETPIDEVIELMDAKHLSSVVVVGKAGVEGIFTLTDAMRAFTNVVQRTEEGDR